jgi:hypothetical protein
MNMIIRILGSSIGHAFTTAYMQRIMQICAIITFTSIALAIALRRIFAKISIPNLS